MSVFGSMSCQPCGGMTYSESGNTGATCKTCARGQVPTQERDGCGEDTGRGDTMGDTPACANEDRACIQLCGAHVEFVWRLC